MSTEGYSFQHEGISGIEGFKCCGVSCGLKNSGKKDLALIFSEVPAVAAGVFTTNKVKAAPVLLDMENIKNRVTRAIVINSGNANACTGDKGMENAKKMAKTAALLLGIKPEEVLVSSTGVIGVQLPVEKVEEGIAKAVDNLSINGGDAAASAIMTTDTRKKKIALKVSIGGKEVKIGAIAKGSGMIHPNMATMLCYILTDANVDKDLLQEILKEAVDSSFNVISVDGDTSTNDSVITMASGMAGNKKITKKDEDYNKLLEAYKAVAAAMAQEIIRDGEGATKFLQVKIINAGTIQDARIGARAIISSSLVKAAFFGEDANWGRILCALGYSGAYFDPEKVELYINSVKGTIKLVDNGEGLDFDEEMASHILKERDIEILVDLHDGKYNAVAWGCDLSYDYVKINGSYRS